MAFTCSPSEHWVVKNMAIYRPSPLYSSHYIICQNQNTGLPAVYGYSHCMKINVRTWMMYENRDIVIVSIIYYM